MRYKDNQINYEGTFWLVLYSLWQAANYFANSYNNVDPVDYNENREEPSASLDTAHITEVTFVERSGSERESEVQTLAQQPGSEFIIRDNEEGFASASGEFIPEEAFDSLVSEVPTPVVSPGMSSHGSIDAAINFAGEFLDS